MAAATFAGLLLGLPAACVTAAAAGVAMDAVVAPAVSVAAASSDIVAASLAVAGSPEVAEPAMLGPTSTDTDIALSKSARAQRELA